MKKIILAAAASLAITGSAWAGAHESSLTDVIVNNTILVEGANGSMVVDMEADGTYTTDTGISGTWTLEGNTLCVERSTGEANCNEIPDGVAVGSSWDSQDAAGNAVKMTVQ